MNPLLDPPFDPRNDFHRQLCLAPTLRLVACTQLVEDEFESELTSHATPEAIRTTGQDAGTPMERVIELAGRVCYESHGTGRTSSAFHRHLAEVGHGSVCEHVSMTFAISGVSRGLTHELVRHRVGVAISQRSTRYVDESQSRIVVPPTLVIWPWDSHEVTTLKLQAQRRILEAHQAACDAYKALVTWNDAYVSRKAARGAARAVLGNGLETSLVWTCNLRTLLNVAKQRANESADLEIRLLLVRMLKLAQNYAPAYLTPPVVEFGTGKDFHPLAKVQSL